MQFVAIDALDSLHRFP